MQPEKLRALVRGHDALEMSIRRERNQARRKTLLTEQIDILMKIRDGMSKMLEPKS